MRRLLGEEEPEFESLIASPFRSRALPTTINRRGSLQMDRRSAAEISLDDVEVNDGPAMVHVDVAGGGYASFNPSGHAQEREDEDSPVDNAPPLFSKYGDFHTIDWQRDLARDRLRHKLIVGKRADFPLGLLQAAWDAGAGWICVLLVGLAAGATAGIIDIGARWMSDLKDGVCADRFWLDREHCCWSSNDTVYKDSDCSAWTTWPEMFSNYDRNPFYYMIEYVFYVGWAVIMATLAVLLVKVFAPYACGSGIPEIKCILSGFVIRGYLGKWTFIIKSVGLILSSASGLSLGKEGPMVHLACCIGNIFSYLFPKYGMNEAKKREILSASAAAGVSVAFGAPIGGVLFSLEEASYYFPLKTMWRSFFCALIAGIILRIVNPFGSDQTSLFHVDYMMKWTFIELIPFAGLGLFGGILGSLFIFANIRFRKTSKILGQNPIYEVVIVTFLTAAISYFNPYMRKSASAMIKLGVNVESSGQPDSSTTNSRKRKTTGGSNPPKKAKKISSDEDDCSDSNSCIPSSAPSPPTPSIPRVIYRYDIRVERVFEDEDNLLDFEHQNSVVSQRDPRMVAHVRHLLELTFMSPVFRGILQNSDFFFEVSTTAPITPPPFDPILHVFPNDHRYDYVHRIVLTNQLYLVKFLQSFPPVNVAPPPPPPADGGGGDGDDSDHNDDEGGEDDFIVFSDMTKSYAQTYLSGPSTSNSNYHAAHVLFLGHLLVGYFFSESDKYDITWTTPFCIMTLRFIGLVMDVHDGVHFEKMKPDQQKTAIREKPSLLEIAAFGYFFTGTLVGPQFTLSRFRDFVNGHHLDENRQPKQSALMPSLGRFLAGCTYMVLHQWGAVWITSEWLNSDDFDNRSFFMRWTWATIWFRLTMYRYCAMWLISEGAAILNGIAYNGKDKEGNDRWDGVRDLHIVLWETGHDFTSVVLSFNVGTNTFAKNHLFRRLRWLNSKAGAHLLTLTYLAVWHGYHLGYFLLFFFEFACMVAQEQLYSLIERTPGWAEFLALKPVRPFVWLFGRLCINYSMASVFLCMGLIKTKYWIRPVKSLYFIGFILYFLVWPVLYQVLLRVLPRKPKKKDTTTDKSTRTAVPSTATESKKEL